MVNLVAMVLSYEITLRKGYKRSSLPIKLCTKSTHSTNYSEGEPNGSPFFYSTFGYLIFFTTYLTLTILFSVIRANISFHCLRLGRGRNF
ncbi:hypothetical protein VIBNIFTn2_350004 [Vibrio nigripulchritudo FTn2]|nr:hypothetical protein VIBNIFTn2_350004 [Vibrio nigripulchritudo FTn2]